MFYNLIAIKCISFETSISSNHKLIDSDLPCQIVWASVLKCFRLENVINMKMIGHRDIWEFSRMCVWRMEYVIKVLPSNVINEWKYTWVIVISSICFGDNFPFGGEKKVCDNRMQNSCLASLKYSRLGFIWNGMSEVVVARYLYLVVNEPWKWNKWNETKR